MVNDALVVDYTTLSWFAKCPVYYKLRVVDNIVPLKKSRPVWFGGAIHLGLSEWYNSHDLGKALKVFEDNYEETQEDDLRTIFIGKRILTEYTEKWKEEPFKVIYNEHSFVVELGKLSGRPILYAGRFDQIIVWDKWTGPFETKTTTRLGYSYFKQFSPNLQVDGYCILCKALLGKCDGVYINAIAVTKTSEHDKQHPKGKKEPKTGFLRYLSSRTEEQIVAAEKNIIKIAGTIDLFHRKDLFYQSKDRCEDYGSCEYKDICKSNFDKRIIEMRYKRQKWNPLLGREEGVKETKSVGKST